MLKNIQAHMERTFELWNKKHPDNKIKIYRSFLFLCCLTFIVIWPWQNILGNITIIILGWILLGITPQKIPYWLLMLHMQFNIAWIYSFVNYILVQLA